MTTADGRNWLPTLRCPELSPSDDLLDLLQHQDRGSGNYDCAAAANNCFEGRVGSLRRRRRSAVTPELMQMDRERATASPTPASVALSPSPQGISTPDPPPRTSRRRLLPQPNRAVALELADAGAAPRNKDTDLRCPASSPISSRYFVPISNREEQQQKSESHTPSFRRLPLVVDASVDGSLAPPTVAAISVPRDHRLISVDEATSVTNVRENKNNVACSSHVDSRRDDAEVLPSGATATSRRRQHRQHYTISTTNESGHFNDNDDDKLVDLPVDEPGQLSSRLTFRSSTLPRRWKWHVPSGESVNRRDCRELWTTQAGQYKDVEDVTESQSSASNNNCSNPNSTQSPPVTSVLAPSRVEAMKQRFRRLSEMYKNSFEEESVMLSTKTNKPQYNDVNSIIETPYPANANCSEAGSKATTTSAWKSAATGVMSDTESLSSCGRDEGFESETATSSVVNGADAVGPESLHSHGLSVDDVATATEAASTSCSEANLFASSIDSIQQTGLRPFDGHNAAVAAADASPSSRETPAAATDEVGRRSEMSDHCEPDRAAPTSASNRLSRFSQQKAFADRMSAPRRSVTRSPQRRTAASSSSDAASRSGLYCSPMVRRKARTPASAAANDEVDETSAPLRFVRGSVTRTSLPHSGVSVRRTPASAMPAGSKDQKQSLTLTSSKSSSSSSRASYRLAGRIRDSQTVKAAAAGATAWFPRPIAAHVDRNGVQTKPSSSVGRVYSTPVRFGPTSHLQNRPARDASIVQLNPDDEKSGTSDSSKQKGRVFSTDGPRQRRKNQSETENEPEITSDSPSAATVSERKSVFERLFERSQRQHSKQGTSGTAAAAAQRPTAESQRKLSSRRRSTSSTNSGTSVS